MLSKTSKYGVRAILHLAIHSNDQNLIGVKKLATDIQISEPMLSKVLQLLTKNNLIESKKGRNGGFYMSDAQKSSYLIHVIKTLEQSEYILTGCLMGQKQCEACYLCPYHEKVQSIRSEFKAIYGTDTIEETAIKIRKQFTYH